jgi:competence ComEA-like helix-hairpin-helix protein
MQLRPGNIIFSGLIILGLALWGWLQEMGGTSQTELVWPAESEQLDVNQATQNEFATLPSIGLVLAGRIVALRQEQHGFKQVEDLLKVKGIGSRKMARIKSYLCLDSRYLPQVKQAFTNRDAFRNPPDGRE